MVINETSKNITNNQHEEEQQQTDELKKKINRLQDELALMAYMAGNMGTVYEMEAVNEFLSAEALEV